MSAPGLAGARDAWRELGKHLDRAEGAADPAARWDACVQGVRCARVAMQNLQAEAGRLAAEAAPAHPGPAALSLGGMPVRNMLVG